MKKAMIGRMRITLTAEETEKIKRAAIVRVARAININEIDLKSNYELWEEIQNVSVSHLEVLSEFMTAYEEWAEIALVLSGFELSDGEKSRLSAAAEKKNLARINLATMVMAQVRY